MLNILVCIKQVPETNEVEIDAEKGTLKREGVDSKINLYDLYALESAVLLAERYGGKVTVLSMGPPQARAIITEAYSLGADRGILLSDRKFAGADTLATAYTISQAIAKLGIPDLIFTGMQTSDGDTAQVGPAVAELLNIPHVSHVKEILSFESNDSITIAADMTDSVDTLKIKLPCLLTVTKEVCRPRLPSYRLKKEARGKTVEIWTYADIKPETGIEYFGLDGSPTQVERIFSPSSDRARETWNGSSDELAAHIDSALRGLKFI